MTFTSEIMKGILPYATIVLAALVWFAVALVLFVIKDGIEQRDWVFTGIVTLLEVVLVLVSILFTLMVMGY